MGIICKKYTSPAVLKIKRYKRKKNPQGFTNHGIYQQIIIV